MSLSGVVMAWPSQESAEIAIQRSLAALSRVNAWGGNQVLDINEVEREYTAWNLRLAGQQSCDARNAMEALPLVLAHHSNGPASRVEISSFTAGQIPPCVPVVDDVGHLTGVVDRETLRHQGEEVLGALDEHFEPDSTTLRGDTRFEDIVASLESADSDYLLVVENKKPIGYITGETVAALRPKVAGEVSVDSFAAADCGLDSLVVPLI
jgi:CBS domain-containing protein